ncbi:MAG: hypothetical protein A3H70_00145 [Candidatus Komeilibacteria bacterium RIFCSPLOWO2_02_FULL_48_11]|uniref:GxxExxY protein n=1 Tax=Candidatus Komeilibacteria bacterium RIFCSPLOWO2_02_FULL_48_11 TaxID=1798553 RepID=A0A1G2BQM5_9BACT|nr:MAG: hypothetical protein A3H70_00145 [Candidatus Komeilibacteria bacterium RIFCSPLOWO2_02_FULL_48_11]
MEEDKVIYKELSYELVGILYDVYNELGYGHPERYYQKAIAVALQRNNLLFKEQVPYVLKYKNKVIGRYFLDFLIDDKIVLELKKDGRFAKKNIEQVKSYLQATNMKLAILANFTPEGVKFLRVLNIK